MSVPTTTNRVQYNCDGSQVDFAFTFAIFETSDLVVTIADSDGTETTLTETADYTVAAAGNDYSGGGTVTTVTTYPSGYTITIVRTVTIDQGTDFRTLDVLPAETLEDALDRLTMISQQIKEQVDRTVKLQTTSGYSNLTIPDPEADKYLAWKSDLSGLKNVSIQSSGLLTVTSYIETLLDDADAAAARATLDVLQDIADVIKSSHIDWGSGADQVDLDEVPDGTTYSRVAAGSVDASGNVETIKDQGGVATNGLKCKVIEIGDWNMDTTASINLDLGISFKLIRAISIVVRDDSDTHYYPSPNMRTTPGQLDIGFHFALDVPPEQIQIDRVTGSIFDSTNFDSTSYNRGWVTIWYEA